MRMTKSMYQYLVMQVMEAEDQCHARNIKKNLSHLVTQ